MPVWVRSYGSTAAYEAWANNTSDVSVGQTFGPDGSVDAARRRPPGPVVPASGGVALVPGGNDGPLAPVPPPPGVPGGPPGTSVVSGPAGMVSPLSVDALPQLVEFYHLDALGSVRVITNEAGTILRRHDYQPFGEELPQVPPQTPSSTDTRLFTGQERDFETGLDYFNARYLATTLGRFTTPDPLAPTPDALVDPQDYNVYVYAHNNPLRFIDPDGMDAVDASGVLMNMTSQYFPVAAFRTETVQYVSRMAVWFDSGGPEIESQAPSIVLAELSGFARGAASGAAASIDGAIPFFDPLAALGVYDPSAPGVKFSKVVGGQSLSLLASLGVPIAGALVDGKAGALFGRGGAFFNRGSLRFGWYWEGSARAGRDVIGLRIGAARGTDWWSHIPFYYPKGGI